MSINNKTIKIGVVDDHKIFRNGLIELINFLGDEYEVVLSAGDEKEMFDKINIQNLPQLILIDGEIIDSNAYALLKKLSFLYPSIKTISITMNEEETALIRMLNYGVRGFLCKYVDPNELMRAINAVINKGYHHTDNLTGKLVAMIQNNATLAKPALTDQEMEFLKLACTEDTYKIIANKMSIGVKALGDHQANLFNKLAVNSRVGMVMYAFKNKLVKR